MESKAVVSLANGKKAFGDNEVLKDISLTVNAGDVLAIIGPSGGGKSTLLRCMTLLETLDSGDLSYGDLTVCANDAAGRAVYGGKDVIAAAKTRFGLVFQNFNLFPHYTVLQNVTDALICVQKMPKDEALARGRELLARMGLADKESMVPCDLSGGQQQRVAIARAMAMVIVTHEMGFARDVADHLIFMDGGVIVEQGPASEVINNPQHDRTRAFLANYDRD